jgi:hypothetical protein
VPSAFVRKQRNSPDEFLSRFDAPPGFHSVAQRDATNPALQSLLMVNAEWPMQRARSMAARLLAADPDADPAALSAGAIQLVLGRPARDDERGNAAAFLRDQQDRIELDRPKDKDMESSSPSVDGGKWFPGIVPAGEPSLSFRPGSEHEKIRITTAVPEDLGFSIEAIVWLDSLQPDASVRSIASRWNGNQASKGWSFGITGMKSRFSPGQLIMQLNGEDFQAALTLEVVVSGLTIPLRTPFYVAAVLSPESLPEKNFGGHIRFFAKDLSDPSAALMEARVPHSLGSGFINPDRALVVGGRDGPGHLWTGGIHRLVMSRGEVTPEARFEAPGTIIDLNGSAMASAGSGPIEWIKPPRIPAANPAILEALADLFHILINSNEFLYLP